MTGTVISSTAFNTLTADLATGLSTCVLKDGTQTLTANIPMSTFKLTGLASGSARTDSINVGQVEDGFPNYVGTVGGTADVITLTPSPAITAYAAGQRFTFIASGANTTNVTVATSGLAARALTKYGSVALVASDIPSGALVTIVDDGTRYQIDKIDFRTAAVTVAGTWTFSATPLVENLINGVCEGRATFTTGVPVTTSDVTAAETVYFTPYKGNRIGLYDGTNWELHTFAELSIDIPDATQMQDMYIYSNSGTPTIELTTWTNDTTRATAITLQNGVYSKTGALTRRYVAAFYSTTAGNGQSEDSVAKRYLSNYYNRVLRPMRVVEGTNTWTYSTAAFQQTNAAAANQLDFVVGVREDIVKAQAIGISSSATADLTTATGIGLDSTTVNSAQILGSRSTPGGGASNIASTIAEYEETIAVGKHLLVWLEYASGATVTWYGDNGGSIIQSGITGEIWG